MKKLIKILSCYTAAAILHTSGLAAQAVTLSADGPGNTYELITTKFAPGNGINAVEHAECSTAHPSFGRHVAEVFDATLNKFVFSFYIHLAQDNDRCTSATDRQRVEIKTYESSTDNLKGTAGESITYKWLFKIPAGFKVSTGFTHIHQIKPVNGDDGNPLFTLTARKGSGGNPNALELIVNNTTKVATPPLSDFEGEWVEATEFITVGANGVYSMKVRRLRDNAMLINYTNMNIMTIRPDNDFIRPKWGIYRSTNTPADLRDDSLQFADFSIEENTVLAAKLLNFSGSASSLGNLLQWKVTNDNNTAEYQIQRSVIGLQFSTIATIPSKTSSGLDNSYSFIDQSPVEKNYYRLRIVEKDLTGSTSAIVYLSLKKSGTIQIFPNPVINASQIHLADFKNEGLCSRILSNDGKLVSMIKGSVNTITVQLSAIISKLQPALYILQVQDISQTQQINFLKK